MFKEVLNKKMIGLIMHQKILRLTTVLNLIFTLILITLIVFNLSYSKQVLANEKQIQDAKNQLTELERIVNEEGGEADSRVLDRSFASYDEIVPFIGLLESLFAIIDKESKILVRDSENQILINRYADYEVKLKPGNKMSLFLKALDELQKSKYITKVTQFTMNYAPKKEGAGNEIDEVSVTIRLYFE